MPQQFRRNRTGYTVLLFSFLRHYNTLKNLSWFSAGRIEVKFVGKSNEWLEKMIAEAGLEVRFNFAE